MFNTDANLFANANNFTKEYLSPKVVDNILETSVLLQILQWSIRSFAWKSMSYNVKYKKSNEWWSFSWLDVLSSWYQDTSAKMNFSPRFYEKYVAVPLADVTANMTQEWVIDLITYQTEEAKQEMWDEVNTMLYWDWTWNWWKDFLWLTAWAWDSTTSTEYWGLNRATYWLEWNVDRTTYDGANKFTFADLDAMNTSVETWNYRVNLYLTTKAIFDILKALYPTAVQNTNAFTATDKITNTNVVWALWANIWYRQLNYNWVPILVDDNCTDKHLFALNSNTWELALFNQMANTSAIKITTSTIEGQYDKNLEVPVMFHEDEWNNRDNQYAMSKRYYMWWNLICKMDWRY